jgi:hypothetical protein
MWAQLFLSLRYAPKSTFDVAGVGQHFLNGPREAATPPITIVLNWYRPVE